MLARAYKFASSRVSACELGGFIANFSGVVRDEAPPHFCDKFSSLKRASSSSAIRCDAPEHFHESGLQRQQDHEASTYPGNCLSLSPAALPMCVKSLMQAGASGIVRGGAPWQFHEAKRRPCPSFSLYCADNTQLNFLLFQFLNEVPLEAGASAALITR